LHIAIDAHSVGAGLAGVETYITNLIEALAASGEANRYTLYVTKGGAGIASRDAGLTSPCAGLYRTRLSYASPSRSPSSCAATRPICSTCNSPRRPSRRARVVATIHDLSFEHLPETFNRRSWMQLRLTVRRTAREAAHLIVPSEYTRRDICETYGIAPARVSVVPLAAASCYAPVADAKGN
jgi:hypothetical protein